MLPKYISLKSKIIKHTYKKYKGHVNVMFPYLILKMPKKLKSPYSNLFTLLVLKVEPTDQTTSIF